MTHPHVLLADDDPLTRRLVGSALVSWGYSLELAKDGNEAWAALTRPESPSLAVIDWIMPGLDGLEICRRLRQQRGSYVYVLLLTAKSDKADLLVGLDAGADDYMRKPFELEELQARLRTGVRILRLEQELRQQATKDALTGLWNRGAILDLVGQELQRGRRSRSHSALLVVDLDHFKSINDRFGHLVGDSVLQQCAQRMQRTLRSYDSIGRYGGEEFLVLLPQCDPLSAQTVAERIRQAIEAKPVVVDGRAIPVTTSIGVTTTFGELDANPATLIQHADEALYAAKSNGRNRVQVWLPHKAQL